MNSRPIGIFDSGFGGLSVWREIKNLMPRESLIYFGDNGHCPYGVRSSEEIRKLALSALQFLAKKECKLLVVACNTATVAGIDYYRQMLKLPIIGLVPIVKKAAELTRTKKIAVISTPFTAESPYQKNLIEKFCQGIAVYNLGVNKGLVEKVEAGEIDSQVVRQVISENLKPLSNTGIDVLVLGCTHYVFLKKVIEDAVGSAVVVLDSGAAVARHVKRVLENEKLLAEHQTADYQFFTSGNSPKFQEIAQKLLEIRIEKVYQIES